MVTPVSLKWNATNELLITAPGSANKLVDISLEVRAQYPTELIYRQTLQAKVAGKPQLLNKVL